MMEEQINHIDYSHAIKAIKNAILQSRYNAAKLVNKEILSLYYGIGEYIAQNSRIGFWGTNAIKIISDRLQKELPGLRGFSETSLKKMRTFYEEWNDVFSNRPSITDDLAVSIIQQNDNLLVRPLLTDKLNSDDLDSFISIGFTHHYELLLKTTSLILCKSKSKKIVEFAFRDTSKPMGVATYKTASELPIEYMGILPDATDLKKLL